MMLWLVGKVNGAVETCFGFAHPLIKERFNPKACSLAYNLTLMLGGVKNAHMTYHYHYWQNMNENRTLWELGTFLPGLITFYSTTKLLDKSWHVLELRYNPCISISLDEINNAVVIHYNRNMKPWLFIALNQYKNLWTK